ncbi:MAG: uroporphyrinogen-III synthase [Saprospiraceae bacterium]
MKVYITRNIKETDFFKTALEKVGFAVFGESLIEFSVIDFDLNLEADWLFFYSKNGVRFFFNQLNDRALDIIKNKKIGTIGNGTAKLLKQQYQIEPNFIGTGEPLQTSKAFAQKAAGQKVIFPRAKQSKKSIQTQLSKVIQVIDLIVYENRPKSNINVPESDCLVFTSPMNARVYFENYDLKSNQKVVAIGQTTGNELLKIGIKNIVIAKSPNERGLVESVAITYGYSY